MDNFTIDPMPDFMFDPVTMGYNSMTNNMMDNSMVNNLVVDNSASEDLMDITERAKDLVISDCIVHDLMVDEFSLTAIDSMAYAHSTPTIGFPTANTPVVLGDSIDTPMADSPVRNASTTDIFHAGNPQANNFPMTQESSTTGTMVDNSAATNRAASIFTPLVRKRLRHRMLFVDGARNIEGVWLCVKCAKHLDRRRR
ncbi:hypothetical protein N0V84_009171 [Fusarium piperis]|uniref:Uncharacterized protein n=1 Tax=Fusarium piperis TaxID=1435070 RepID=A0A9W8W6S9_9HYPO|nr:hypothetical protein N0V84_009171 [Fusarium piperis]